MMKKTISRREFLLQTAGIAMMGGFGCSSYHKLPHQASVSSVGVPQRILGKTGIQVSQLAFGCGSRFIQGYKSEEKAFEALNWAFSNGINYFDTAHNYGKGESESRLGLFLKEHRKEVFVATKLDARDRNKFMNQFDISLKRLQMDQVDLLNIHGLSTRDDIAQMGAKGGIYERLVKLKEQKGTKFIGFSCHDDGEVAKAAIEQYDFDCCTLQINSAKIGGFEDNALPAALKKNLGIAAIKATGQGRLLGNASGKANIEELLRYAWSLPVACIILGMPNLEMVKQDINLALKFSRMTTSELESLRIRTAQFKPNLERFFHQHSDFGPL